MLGEASGDGGGGAAASNQVGDEEEGPLADGSEGCFTDPVEVGEEGTQTWILGARGPGLKPPLPLAGCVTLGMSHCCPEPQRPPR